MKEILFVTIAPSFANKMILSPSKISFSIDGYFRAWYVEYIFSYYIYFILVFFINILKTGKCWTSFCRILPSIANLSSLQPAWLVYIALLWKQWTAAKMILHPSVTLAWDWGLGILKYSRTGKNIDAARPSTQHSHCNANLLKITFTIVWMYVCNDRGISHNLKGVQYHIAKS